MRRPSEKAFAQARCCTRELSEAEAWLRSAEELFKDTKRGPTRYTVVVAQCIHAIIRVNDGLTSRLLHKKARRHEDAPVLFAEMIHTHKIESSHARFRKLLLKAVVEKSGFDYLGEEASEAEARKWIESAKEFLEFAVRALG